MGPQDHTEKGKRGQIYFSQPPALWGPIRAANGHFLYPLLWHVVYLLLQRLELRLIDANSPFY